MAIKTILVPHLKQEQLLYVNLNNGHEKIRGLSSIYALRKNADSFEPALY